MLQHLLLDIAPYPHERIIKYDTVRAVYPPVAKPDTADTAAAQDFVAGVASGGDDTPMPGGVPQHLRLPTRSYLAGATGNTP